jgi:hypothetical protein
MEFNSLSIVYQKPSERFLKETELKQSIASEKKYFPDRKRSNKLRGEGQEEGEDDDKQDGNEATESLLDLGTNSTAQNQTTGAASSSIDDLLDLGGGSASNNTSNTQANVSSTVDDLLGIGGTPAGQAPTAST